MAGIPIDVVLAREIPVTEMDFLEPENSESCELEDGETIDREIIRSIEHDFVESADEILEMLNLSHLRVSSEN